MSRLLGQHGREEVRERARARRASLAQPLHLQMRKRMLVGMGRLAMVMREVAMELN